MHLHRKIYLIRHAETAWTLTGKHTSKTDLPLTENGVLQAKDLGNYIKNIPLQKIFASPLQRALETLNACHLQSKVYVENDLVEWDYGDFEGLTTQEIRAKMPTWNLFLHGAPGGEAPFNVGQRAGSILAKIHSTPGDIAIFSSGHFLRVLIARWLQMPVSAGQYFSLYPASLSILGYEKETPSLILLNQKFTNN